MVVLSLNRRIVIASDIRELAQMRSWRVVEANAMSSGGCRKSFSTNCVRKGHMIECSVHRGVYFLPGNSCATCVAVAEAEARAAKKAAKGKK